MKIYRTFSFKKNVRFRRWCKKGYAVFCSLIHQVTIGVLAASICDKSTLKSKKSILTDIPSEKNEIANFIEKGPLINEDFLLLFNNSIAINFSIASSNDVDLPSANQLINFIQRLRKVPSFFNRFFINFKKNYPNE